MAEEGNGPAMNECYGTGKRVKSGSDYKRLEFAAMESKWWMVIVRSDLRTSVTLEQAQRNKDGFIVMMMAKDVWMLLGAYQV